MTRLIDLQRPVLALITKVGVILSLAERPPALPHSIDENFLLLQEYGALTSKGWHDLLTPRALRLYHHQSYVLAAVQAMTGIC